MGKPTGFKEYNRELPGKRPVEERIRDFKEIYHPFAREKLKKQAARCMDCGVPTCHAGCPLGNLIPDWNDFLYRDRWRDALGQLLLINNFPEFTGRLCPAPCEEACVLAINEPPVTIEQIEKEIIEHAFEQGWIRPEPPHNRIRKTVAVIGSGPSGLACAQQLNRAGHTVTVYERADRVGGLLRYGIPDFKLEKWVLDRRLDLMRQEGIQFETSINVGVDVSARELARFDAQVICTGATIPRDLPLPGRNLEGVHFAMEFLTRQNRWSAGDDPVTANLSTISAKGKNVIVIGAAGRVDKLITVDVEFVITGQGSTEMREVADSTREWPADLVLIAMGFTGPEPDTIISSCGLKLDERGNIDTDSNYMSNVPGVFAAGDANRGQSLIVWAISEGREAARCVDAYRMGTSVLPAKGGVDLPRV